MIKQTRPYLGLKDYPVYIEDSSDLSPDLFVITSLPKTLTTGVNAVFLKVDSDNFTPETPLLVEVLDSTNNPIYYEVPDWLSKDMERMIAIHIHDDTPPGNATITLIGQTDKLYRNEEIPSLLVGKPNVRWSHTFFVDITKRNNTNIYFEDDVEPQITIEEKIRPYMLRSFSTTQFVTQSNAISYKLSGITPTIEITGATTFLPEHLGARIKLTPANAIPASGSSFDSMDKVYYANIESIETSTKATLSYRYYVTNTSTLMTYVPKTFTDAACEIHYEALPTYTLTQNSRSLALITVNDLLPICGEVERIKSFYKSNGSAAGWEVIDDSVIKESEYNEILIDTSSIDVKTRLGTIVDSNTISNYWTAQLYTRYNGVNVIDPPTYEGDEPMAYDQGTILFRSFYPYHTSTVTHPTQFLKITPVGTLGEFHGMFDECGEYTLQLNLLGRTSTSIGSGVLPHIEFYMSGSAFDYKANESGLGKKIGEINVGELLPGTRGNSFRYMKQKFSFIADRQNTGMLLIKVNSGDWYFSDISIKPTADLGYTPCQTKMLIPIPTNHINDQLDFKFEYYNHENAPSKVISYVNNISFAGGNTYIGGSNNMLTGSLHIGNQIGTGLEIIGLSGGGLIRTSGYRGYVSASAGTAPPGFAIWSGSAMANYSGEDYNGVGIEFHGGGTSGSFKFRGSKTPEFEIAAPTFYFGNSIQYISGSNGILSLQTPNFSIDENSTVWISGSFSGSISPGSLPSGILSGSAQIATDISGAFTSVSSSYSTRITSNEVSIITLNSKTGSYATTGSNTFIGNEIISGSLNVSGSTTTPVVIGASAPAGTLTLRATSHSTDGNIIFESDPTTERLRIKSTGELLIGITSSLSAAYSIQTAQGAQGTGILLQCYSTTPTHQVVIDGLKSASDTIGTRIATADNESILVLTGYGINSSNGTAAAGSIHFEQHGAAGATFIPSRITFKTGGAGGLKTEKMRITPQGVIKFAGTAERSAEGTSYLDLFNSGTPPAGTLANGISLYSAAGILKVMNAAGLAGIVTTQPSAINNTQLFFADTNGQAIGNAALTFNSGSGQLSSTSFNGIFNGALSGSAQIASEISGAFTTASGSFSTRTTNLESASGSFSTRTTNLESASGSFSTRVTSLETASGSYSTRLTNDEVSITLLNSKTGSYATTGSNTFNGNQVITGSLSIGTTGTGKQVEINSVDGNCLRLTYNDPNGNATNYVDYTVSSTGNATISASGAEINFTNDIIYTASSSGVPYGCCYGTNLGWTQGTPAVGTWYEISDAKMSDGPLNLVSHDGNGKLTVSKAGTYLITYTVACGANVIGSYLSTAISLSGTEQEAGYVSVEVPAANYTCASAGQGIFTVPVGRTIEVSIRFTGAVTPTGLGVDDLTITCTMIGG